MLTIRWWKPSLAAGVFLVGADGTAFGQPIPPAPPGVGVSTAAACSPGGLVLPAGPQMTRPMARGSLLHPRDFAVAPFGSTVALHFQTHVTNGVAARMALYDYDFVPGTDRLNYRGKDRLRQIAGVMPYNAFPVLVERLPANPRLAEARRSAVLAELTVALGQVPADRVVVSGPSVAPIQGVEAELIYNNLLRLTDSAGTTPGTGVRGGTTGTFSGAGGVTGFGTGGGGLGTGIGGSPTGR